MYDCSVIYNKYNNKYHRKMKIKPADVMSSTHIEYVVEYNDEDPKFGVGAHVGISKYPNIFARVYTRVYNKLVRSFCC